MIPIPVPGALIVIVQPGPADGVAQCPCCDTAAAVHRGKLMCLNCGCVHVPDRTVAHDGPYHDGTAWEACESGLRIGGSA